MPSKVSLINPIHDIATALPVTVQPVGRIYIASVLLDKHVVGILDANFLKINIARVAEHLTTEQLSALYTGAYRRFYLRPGKLVRTCAKLFSRSRPELEYFADRFKTILRIVI